MGAMFFTEEKNTELKSSGAKNGEPHHKKCWRQRLEQRTELHVIRASMGLNTHLSLRVKT